MATAAPTRATPPASRRSSSVTSASPPPIHKGATARSAVSPRVSASLNSPVRRLSVKGVSPPPTTNAESRESLSASLKEETEKKEQLLVQLQDKDQVMATLRAENDGLTSGLHSAESRLRELYADQSRMEEEMAARIEVVEKLRNQVRDLEKEKRDIQRRYNEQTSTFEAERQSFYDNEQHLKSRIQSLSQARKQHSPPTPSSPSSISISESEAEPEEDVIANMTGPVNQDVSDPEQEPAEMTALKLELSTLSTSHASLQSTLVLLQSQLVDLKRVNHELQEENESYNILLREKTLNGQFDIMRMGGASISEASEESTGDGNEEIEDNKDAESFKSRHTSRSTLDRVDEAEELDAVLDPNFEQHPEGQGVDTEDIEESQARNPRSRHSRKRSSIPSRGESLANLPITGPGLDLAAELGRAENKDILDGRSALENEKPVAPPRNRKGKKEPSDRKVSSLSEPGPDSTAPTNDLDALRNEVKSLRDANKALSLYASKIIDRIIAQEGFEHVLAIDYDKSPKTPASAGITTFSNISNLPSPTAPPPKKTRPQSAIFSFGPSTPATPPPLTTPQVERLTTFDSPLPSQSSSPQSNTSSPPIPAASNRVSRRSMSFDWKSFSMFGGGDKKFEPPATLRPLTLKADAPITGARKLDTCEDEEDRRERERLNAAMKLMGIDKPPAVAALDSPTQPMLRSSSAPGAVILSPTTPSTAVPPTPARFSFFRRTASATAASDTSSVNPPNSDSTRPPIDDTDGHTPHLTQETLERAEAEGSLAALDAHERQLSAEIARGSAGGFTELSRRSGDRRSSRRSGSNSTVWSAGMSRDED